MEKRYETKGKMSTESIEAMLYVLNRSIRRKRTKALKIWGGIMSILMIVFLVVSIRVNWGIVYCIIYTVLAICLLAFTFKEERILSMAMMRNVMPDAKEDYPVNFYEEYYESLTKSMSTKYQYENITHIAERGQYIVFIISGKVGQSYRKGAFNDYEGFRAFINEKTGITISSL